MIVTARMPTDLPVGTPLVSGGTMPLDPAGGAVGKILQAEIADPGWLDLTIDIDDESHIATIISEGAISSVSAIL